MNRKTIKKTLNCLILISVIIGAVIMFRSKASATGLTSSGWRNLKYYTVLSNIFAGIVAAMQMVCDARGRKPLVSLKLTAATATALTFLVVAGFFGPLYGWIQFYQGSNLFFHRIVPLLCILEFILMEDSDTLTIRHCMLASLSTVVYGLAYVINLIINGIGVWPDTNDWYGFVNWGYGMAAVIFTGIILVSFGIACLLRQSSLSLHSHSHLYPVFYRR